MFSSDPEFYAGQAFVGQHGPNPANENFQLYALYHGGIEGSFRVGTVPPCAQSHCGWRARIIFLHPQTLFRHIRFHPKHPLPFECVRWITWVIEHGGIIADKEGDLVFFLQVPGLSRAYLWVPVHIDGEGNAVWVKGFHKRKPANVRSKVRRGKLLRQPPLQIERAA